MATVTCRIFTCFLFSVATFFMAASSRSQDGGRLRVVSFEETEVGAKTQLRPLSFDHKVPSPPIASTAGYSFQFRSTWPSTGESVASSGLPLYDWRVLILGNLCAFLVLFLIFSWVRVEYHIYHFVYKPRNGI